MGITKILAIGNSFSEDSTYYLHDLAAASGIETKVVNLYIGGCPLERHWSNIEQNEPAYQYQINGVKTERYVSIAEILAEDEWDYVVTHQASHDSGWIQTYEPFMELLVNYIHQYAPQAEFVIQKTWAYEVDSKHDRFMRYHRSQEFMYTQLCNCYETIAKKYDLRLIPSGDIIQGLRRTDTFNVKKGGMSICRDGFHMHHLYGRYLLAAAWAKYLLGVDLSKNDFMPVSEYLPGVQADPELVAIIRDAVNNH